MRWAFSLLVLLLLSFFFESTQAWQEQDQELCLMEMQDLEEAEASESEDELNDFQFLCFSNAQIGLKSTAKLPIYLVFAFPRNAHKEVDLPPPRV